ncbi:MAG: hypothetical protein ACOX69_02940 [Coriobacteriales bacterium]|jgi:hypothetical protein
MKRVCEACGKVYEAKRSTSRYCSSTCRSRAHRHPYKAVPIYGDGGEATFTLPYAVEDAFRQARVASNMLAAVSNSPDAVPRLRTIAGRVSAAISDALRAEGL